MIHANLSMRGANLLLSSHLNKFIRGKSSDFHTYIKEGGLPNRQVHFCILLYIDRVFPARTGSISVDLPGFPGGFH